MSQREGFAGGFFVGAIIGSIVGGVLGATLTSRLSQDNSDEKESLLKPRKEAQLNSEESIEVARRSLEDKIAQLNLAIDDVRQQLGAVNGNASEIE
ncbi:MAG: hypothetical protein ACRDEA_04905 [Microcystaceae cyanobacterium]